MRRRVLRGIGPPGQGVDDRADAVVVTVSATVSDAPCRPAPGLMTVLTVDLPTALGPRRLVDGHDGAVRPPLPEAEVPRITYPPGRTHVDHGPATADGDRLGWASWYGDGSAPDIALFAGRHRPAGLGRPAERVRVGGAEAGIHRQPGDDRGHGFLVVWQAGDWFLELTVTWPAEDRASRSELQRVLDGPRFP